MSFDFGNSSGTGGGGGDQQQPHPTAFQQGGFGSTGISGVPAEFGGAGQAPDHLGRPSISTGLEAHSPMVMDASPARHPAASAAAALGGAAPRSLFAPSLGQQQQQQEVGGHSRSCGNVPPCRFCGHSNVSRATAAASLLLQQLSIVCTTAADEAWCAWSFRLLRQLFS